MAESIEEGAGVTIFFPQPELRESLLPDAGFARFFGTAEVHRSGPVRDEIWGIILEAERQKDPQRKGFAVLVKLQRAENLRGAPLQAAQDA